MANLGRIVCKCAPLNKKEIMMKTKTKIKKSVSKDEHIFCALMLIIPVVQWLVFTVYANLDSIRMAFSYYDTQTLTFKWLKFNNFFYNFELFIKNVFTTSLHSLFMGFFFQTVSILLLPISYMVAFVITKKVRGAEAFKVILYLPAILSSMVVCLMVKLFIEGGMQGLWYKWTGNGIALLQHEPYNLVVYLIYMLFFSVPGSLLINLGSMSRVPVDLIEYGELEGISVWKEFLLICVPIIYPVLEVQCLGIFVGMFTYKGSLYTIYEGSAPDNLKTFGYELFTLIYGGKHANKYTNAGYTSAANLLIGLVSVPLVQLTRMLFDKFDPEAEF